MCCLRFTISASYRKEVECHLKTAQRLGHVRQVKYLLAILAVVAGQSCAQVAFVLHVHEKTVATWVRLFCCYGLQGKPPGEWPPSCQAASSRAASEAVLDTGGAGAMLTPCPRLSHCWASQLLQS